MEMWKGCTIFAEKKNRGMKIVYIYDAIARIGGVERILVDKMNYLANVYGYEVYLITAAQGDHPFSFPLSDKVKHIDLNARFHLQYQYQYPKRLWIKWKLCRDFKRKLKKQIRSIDPEIVIGTTYYKADVISCLPCRAKKIIESHCAKAYTGFNDGVIRNQFIQFIYNFLLRRNYHTIEKRSDVIVSLTHKDNLEWHKDEKQKFIIPNSIKGMPTASSTCMEKRVISAGRLIYQKGFDRLIKSWSKVHEKHPDWKLDIYGNGKEKENLVQLISSLKLEENITIHPFTKDIFQEYIHSSIYVLPSNYEGFGLVLIEAMSCGVPCVSFDCPYGPDEIIRDNEDGIIVENNNIKKLADAICFLIENDNVRREYGIKARQNIMQYLPENIMPQWKHLFENLE